MRTLIICGWGPAIWAGFAFSLLRLNPSSVAGAQTLLREPQIITKSNGFCLFIYPSSSFNTLIK